jgi:hypothetical protein
MILGLNAIFALWATSNAFKYRPWQTKVRLVDLLIVSFEGRQFLVKMFLENSVLRLVAASSLVLFGLATTAMADMEPYDPHGLYANGGDATPITSTTPITFSVAGGGIFVFNNDTGEPLSEVDVNVVVQDTLAADGFTVEGTIFVPPGSGQEASFSAGFVPNSNCTGFGTSTTTFCEEMKFSLVPGPIAPVNGNFVLDFDDPVNGQYQGLDAQVADGTYTGGTMDGAGQVGSWGDGAQAYVTPIVATPEPQQYAWLLASALALAIFARRRRNAVVQ